MLLATVTTTISAGLITLLRRREKTGRACCCPKVGHQNVHFVFHMVKFYMERFNEVLLVFIRSRLEFCPFYSDLVQPLGTCNVTCGPGCAVVRLLICLDGPVFGPSGAAESRTGARRTLDCYPYLQLNVVKNVFTSELSGREARGRLMFLRAMAASSRRSCCSPAREPSSSTAAFRGSSRATWSLHRNRLLSCCCGGIVTHLCRIYRINVFYLR